MLRHCYLWVLRQADRPHAVWVLAGIAFAESSFFPLPPDLLLIPMMLAARRRIFWLATVATVSSVLGGFLGYAIGDLLYDSLGRWMIEHLFSPSGFAQLQAYFDRWGFIGIVFKGFTPIPYKFVTILCGFVHYNLFKFAVASLLARGLRFFSEAILLFYYGEAVRDFIERRMIWVTTGFVVALVGAFAVFKLL